jgi:gamma-glutamyl-gamma-aminobutyraldehyde dehydrogenase
VLAAVAECDKADVDLAVASARRSLESGAWSRRAPRERKKVLLKFADLIEKHLVELALMESLDCGKPIGDALNVDLPDTVETLRWYAEAIDKIYDQFAPTPHDVVSMIVREPTGAVGAVLPWNFPIFTAMWKIAPALAGGNSMVVKPAEQTPLSALRLAALAAEAGIPDGVLNVVPGFGETAGQSIGRHMDVTCVSFTGSGKIGKLFLKHAGDSSMKRIVPECGGKGLAIVMADVGDLQPVVDQVAAGILLCQGENCSAGSRLIVHDAVKSRLLDRLKPVFESWTAGDPLSSGTRIGALIEEGHLRKVMSYVAIGQSEGARAALWGIARDAEERRIFLRADDTRQREELNARRKRGDLRTGTFGGRLLRVGGGRLDRQRYELWPCGLTLHRQSQHRPSGRQSHPRRNCTDQLLFRRRLHRAVRWLQGVRLRRQGQVSDGT